jgi:hypothetical protein
MTIRLRSEGLIMHKAKRIKTALGIIAAVILALGFLLLKAPIYYQARIMR